MDSTFGLNNDINGNDQNGVPCPYPCSNGFFWANFDPEACCEGNCCDKMGCTDPSAFNYDPTATCNDGSCCYNLSGCICLQSNPGNIFEDGWNISSSFPNAIIAADIKRICKVF